MPTSSIIDYNLNLIGTLLLTIGSGLYLSKKKIAGGLTLIGSGIILETIWHWWYIYIIGPDVTERVGDYETLIISIYTFAFVSFLSFILFGFTSILNKNKPISRLDKIELSVSKKVILAFIPTILYVISLLFVKPLG